MKEKGKKALGRGLEALLPAVSAGTVETGASTLVPVDLIDANPFQPRVDWSQDELQSLSDSIRAQGVIQPLVLRPIGGRYQLIAGERRLRASVMAGLSEVPAVIREADDRQMLALALVENIQRSDLNPMEKAEAFSRFCSEFHLTQEDLGRQVGLSRSAVANFQRLLDLPEKVRVMLRTGQLTMGHGRALLGLSDQDQILRAAGMAVHRGMSVRALEELVRSRRQEGQGKKNGKTQKVSPEIVALEEGLQRLFGTRVRVRDAGGHGSIEIEYASLDELDRLLSIFRSSSR
jgi:ParB family chromosome partitioning protein